MSMLTNGKLQLRGDLSLYNLQATFKNGTEKLAMGNQDEAMTCLDLAVEEINTKVLLTILLHRAAVHESRGNLDLARQDAYSAIAYAKHVADGYIFAYNMHLLEDKLKDAYDVIQEGLKYVSKTNPEYPRLVYLKDNVQAKIDNHNAWRLPYHLVSIILDKLDFVDRVQLASTCMYWRELLYHSPSGAMWSSIDMAQSPTERDSFINLLKTASSKSIRRVEIGTSDILALINQSKWEGIEHLAVKNAFVSDINLKGVLSRSMLTLRELSITNVSIAQGNIERVLYEVLMCLPNLTRFTLHFKAYPEAFGFDHQRLSKILPLSARIPSLPLTHLSFTEIRYLDLLLPSCLNLRYIELLEQGLTGSAPEIFSLVDSHCPNLISFRYGTCEQGIKSPVDELLGNNNSGTRRWSIPSHESGLRELTYFPQKLVDEDVVRTIRSNLATLEILRLNLWALGGSRLYIVHALAADLHNRLRELELRGQHVQFGSGVTNTSADAVCELINVCPNLETLSLDYIDILNDNLYHMVGRHTKIRRLFIRGHIRHMCDHNRPLHKCGLAVMFEKTRTLEDFFVESTTGGIDVSSYFHAMSAHQGLRRVHLKSSGSMNVTDTHRIANVLNRLSYLGLECAHHMTLPKMTFFHLLPRLTWLKLRSGTSVTNMTDEIISTLFYKRRENNAAPLQISVYEESDLARLYWSKTMEKTSKDANNVLPATSLIDDKDPSHMHTLYHNERERLAKVTGVWTGHRRTFPGFTTQAGG